MPKRRLYASKWVLAAMTLGGVLTAIEVYGAVDYLARQGQPLYLIVGGAVVTAVSAGLPLLAARAWHERRWLLAICLWMAMIPALSVILTAAVERTGSTKDGADRDRQAIARKISLAESTVKDAKAEVLDLVAKANAECSRSVNPKADPRGPRCTAAEERVDKGRGRLEAATVALAKAGVAQRDPVTARFTAVLPVSEEAIALYQPLVLPVTISMLGLLLVAMGAHRPAPVLGRQGKRKRRRRMSAVQSSRGNVVPLRKSS